MKKELEAIRAAANQSTMYAMIEELATEIVLTDNSLLSIDKQWVNYGTWRSNCFANRFYFGENLANELKKNLSKRITHDEDVIFDIKDFTEEIEESIYNVL